MSAGALDHADLQYTWIPKTSMKLKGVLSEFASSEKLRDELTYLENFELEYNEQANEILNINTVVYIFIHTFLTGFHFL